MIAVVCTEPGPPDVLLTEERTDPAPSPGWAVVRVRARGVNRSEVMTRQGHSGDRVRFPRVLGIEAVGDVVAVPPGLPLEQAAEAHRRLEAGGTAGKIVLVG